MKQIPWLQDLKCENKKKGNETKSCILNKFFFLNTKTAVWSTEYVKLTDGAVLSGGLAAVIYTDTLQTLIMFVGAIILTVTGACRH